MNPETGTFTSMDTYAGTLDNPVSLHKYLYANANPVMYTDPSGYFSLAELSVAQSIQSTINSVIVPYFNVKKIMSWANLAVTMYALKSQCFTGDTMVSMVTGERRIDEIEAGDYVWSYDSEIDEKVLAKVTNVSVIETDVLVHLITSEWDELGGVNILIALGRLGLNNLDIAEALRTDLENAIKLFER